MPIRYLYRPQPCSQPLGGLRPLVFCDVCGRRVRDAKEAHVEWDQERMEAGGAEPLFVHKPCSDRLRKEYPGRQWLWAPMDDFLQHLRRNMEPAFPRVCHRLYVTREGRHPEPVRTRGEGP